MTHCCDTWSVIHAALLRPALPRPPVKLSASAASASDKMKLYNRCSQHCLHLIVLMMQHNKVAEAAEAPCTVSKPQSTIEHHSSAVCYSTTAAVQQGKPWLVQYNCAPGTAPGCPAAPSVSFCCPASTWQAAKVYCPPAERLPHKPLHQLVEVRTWRCRRLQHLPIFAGHQLPVPLPALAAQRMQQTNESCRCPLLVAVGRQTQAGGALRATCPPVNHHHQLRGCCLPSARI